MEAKAIIYIIAGILYFLYTIGKKVQEKQKSAPSRGATSAPKPVSPPDYNRDKEKRKVEAVTQMNKPLAQPVNVAQQQEKKSYYDIQGNREAAKRTTPDVGKTVETSTKPEAESDTPFEFDARQAFIGSIIFDRKY